MTEAFSELLSRKTHSGAAHPTIVTLGGDHSIALAALRALKGIYGPIAVLHFDARICPPVYLPSY
jgi:agmatinase